MGQAEKMMEETKAKAAELQEMAMEKVNNCKVSWYFLSSIKTAGPQLF